MVYYRLLLCIMVYYRSLWFNIVYHRLMLWSAGQGGMAIEVTPSPPIKSLGFEGFDSSRLLIRRGGNSHVRLI